MTETRSTVLLAGIGRGPFEAIAPVLDRRDLRIERVGVPEEAVALASAKRFDLVVFDAEPESLGLAELVERLRDVESASRGSSLLVVAEPSAAQEVGELIGQGVNRVVSLEMSEDVIDQHVADLLDIAPRAAVRFSARLTTVLDDGTTEVVGLTANVSMTGVLLETSTVLGIGQPVAFEFLIREGDDMVSGEATVVRRAVAERGGVDGIGLRFLKFHADSRERLESALTEACVIP